MVGNILQGSWLIIEYVEQLDKSVLSVIGQLIFEFKNAKSMKKKEMLFGKDTFNLHPQSNFIFTMDNCMDS